MPPTRKLRHRAPDPSLQRVDINISTGRPNSGEGTSTDPAKQARINSNLKRMKAIRDKDPRVMFTGQSPSDYYGIGRDDISQIVATRAPVMSPEKLSRLEFAAQKYQPDDVAGYVHANSEGRIEDEGRGTTPSGKPNRTLKPNWIVDDIVRKYDAGQKRMTIDELAAGTSKSVQAVLQQLAAERPDIMKGLSLYLASGPGTGPDKFKPELIQTLKRSKIPVYAQVYGGKANKEWTDKQWRGAMGKFNAFRDAGLNVKPLMSFSDQHIGQGPQAVAEARERAWRIFNETGYIPSIWHATSVRAPSPEGLGAAAQRWIQRMRGK